jgi:hypothetical protein
MVDRGPCMYRASPLSVHGHRNTNQGPGNLTFLEAPPKREIAYCQRYGKPRLHVERYLRSCISSKRCRQAVTLISSPTTLKLAPHLDVPSDHPLARPVLRHPDFSPNNILVNSSNDIVGVIDWQHAVVLPLCFALVYPTTSRTGVI